jgi:2-dehydro-3-deoxyphosphogluconate aldolase/(4S)-4-hydroxy-2-oxoglutarate aldolase
MEGYALDYRRFKLFPAEVCCGVAALKALGGPFTDVRFCPTGGVTAANAASYLALPNVMCVGGTWMIDSKSLSDADWPSIQQRTAEALAALT